MARDLADFIGRWVIEREIVHAGAPPAQFVGQAEWTATTGGADYFETGVLKLAGHSDMQAERRYRWDNDLNVYFDDGRFFHQVPALGGGTEHWCDPDDYKVAYDFDHWPQWSARWAVQGPRKNYVMTSRYRQA